MFRPSHTHTHYREVGGVAKIWGENITGTVEPNCLKGYPILYDNILSDKS